MRQVRKDIAILDQMFLINVIKPYFTNRGRELRQTNKIYFFDSGIKNAILRDFRALNLRQDKGTLLESFVFNEIKKNLQISQDIYYWRTREKDEVDFILVQDRTPIAIEVKSKLTNTEIPTGLKQFLKKYSECPQAIVLNNSLHQDTVYQGKTIRFIPHYYASLIPSLFTKV